nr:hypothetical protein [Nonlabens ulvanivorans]
MSFIILDGLPGPLVLLYITCRPISSGEKELSVINIRSESSSSYKIYKFAYLAVIIIYLLKTMYHLILWETDQLLWIMGSIVVAIPLLILHLILLNSEKSLISNFEKLIQAQYSVEKEAT